MPRRRATPSGPLRATIVLAIAAAACFVGGEALLLTRTDAGRLQAARWLHLGDAATVRAIVARHAREGLENAGVPADSIRESVSDGAEPRVRWRVGLRPRSSTLQANYAVTRALGEAGAVVLSGREAPGAHGETRVTLVLGLPHRPTHELVLVRAGHEATKAEALLEGRIALVLADAGDDLAEVSAVLARPQPFAIAIPAGRPWSAAAFRAARKHQRETVLHLPLEPLDYPRNDPGPGTILVTMGGSRVAGVVRHDLDEAGPVVAVANLAGSLATQDQAVMSAVYRVLRDRNLPFLHLTPAPGSVCRTLASTMGVEYARPDLVLEASGRAPARRLDAGWKRALELARRRGRAIVVLRASDAALAWLPGAVAPKRLGGVEIVPLTALVRKPL